MITKEFALKIFEGFSIERWNDLIRPVDLVEMDKVAEKTMLAYVIGKYEEKKGETIEWEQIFYYSVFDLLKKISLCDIKAPVQRMIHQDYPDEYLKLNKWVLEQYKPLITDKELLNRFELFLLDSPDKTNTTWRIFRAAHKFSTLREFEIIKHFNDYSRLIEIEKEINTDISKYMDLQGLQLLITKQRPYDFLLFIEQLRYQSRWNQTPRVPKTSVLGHSYFVAILTFLIGREHPMCKKRVYNNFFSALFHDLPEAVTRDIISPVKQATDHLPEIVKKIEDAIVKKELIPTMDESFRDELVYFTNDEFENRIINGEGKTQIVDYDELCICYNEDGFSPVDGKLVRIANHPAAFMEADRSIHHGITSVHLKEGRKNILKNYPAGLLVNGNDVSSFLMSFLEDTIN